MNPTETPRPPVKVLPLSAMPARLDAELRDKLVRAHYWEGATALDGDFAIVAIVSRFRRRPQPFDEGWASLENSAEVHMPTPVLVFSQAMDNKTIYILGAGCSVDYGYPLANDFLADLKEYGRLLEERV